jgi:glucokinase
MPERYAIGVDFGGTKLLASVVDIETGKLISSAKRKTNASDSPDELMGRLYAGIDESIRSANVGKKRSIAGIGVGLAGQIDSARGILLGAPNLSQATVNLPIAEMLANRYGMPAALLNDVQIAAIGEATFGAGVGSPNFLCVFVGTGIGGAIVREGTLVRGYSGSAGEIGHLVVDAGGRICGCGGRGHLEAYASRTAMTKAILAELKRGRPSVLRKLAPELEGGDDSGAALRSGLMARAISEKDELVTETFQEAGGFLGLGLASVINLLNPERIILGGGVIEAVPFLFEVATKRAKREALAAPAAAVHIVKAKLGDNSGVVGAALLGAQAAS